MITLNIDLETYSKNDIDLGVHKYAQEAEILLFAYSFNNSDVYVVDLLHGEQLPEHVLSALTDPKVIKKAWNAAFEITVLSKCLDVELDATQWHCTMVRAARCGYPLGLGEAAKALNLEQQKDTKGKALIKKFCTPKTRMTAKHPALRHYPTDSLDLWEDWLAFKEYARQDVVTEMAIDKALSVLPDFSPFEQRMYALDRRINERGIELDLPYIRKIISIDEEYKDRLAKDASEFTGLENPNSLAQLKEWFEERGLFYDSLNKDALNLFLEQYEEAIDPIDQEVLKMLQFRKELSNTSVRKYIKMIQAEVKGRIHDTIQFNGAARTGRNAGRLIQPQNLPRIYMKDDALDQARRDVMAMDLLELEAKYPAMSSLLSQLIRTALISKEGHILRAVDLSAIEARIVAWLADEKYDLEVFRTHGKIYEATASAMFKIPLEEITKDSPYRQRGKVASLACVSGDMWLTVRDKGSENSYDIKLRNLQTQQLVWDGSEFVEHGGLLYKGIKQTICYGGLSATSDHLVKYGPSFSEWVSLEEARDRNLPIKVGSEKYISTPAALEPVFDIHMCGPRNQFMANGCIVHNCGYQGAVNAITVMDVDRAIADEDKPGLVKSWRAAHPATVKYWKDIENAAKKAIKNPISKITLTKGCYFIYTHGHLLMYLSSGRYLCYPGAHLAEKQTSFGTAEEIRYFGIDQYTNKWKCLNTYGGKLLENQTQAIARDVLMVAMDNFDKAGYSIVTNVHDEIVTEDPLGFGSLEDLEALMCDMPSWAEGLPLGAEGFESKYYKK